MSGEPRDSSSMARLCALIEPGRPADFGWTASDYGAMATHFLAARLRDELGDAAAGDGEDTRGASMDVSIGELLASPSASAAQLTVLKAHVKALLAGRGGIPRDVAKALYVAVVARGRGLPEGNPSRLGAREFERLARWCLAQPWVPPPLADVVRAAVGTRVDGNR